MILVDASVWISYFSSAQASRETEILDRLLGRQAVLIGDLILVEVLQGFRTDSGYRNAKAILSACEIRTLCSPTLAVLAADRYRALRKRGVTIRKTIDVIIASYCIEEGLHLLSEDRDFAPFQRHLGLQLI
jgi:predicted nucleic acid-binding protein